ncbi:4'-phosphopantetheinyl transferase family protein [Myroides pelagicus]|uniref:4'-phosphopantetheinyl transferase superfamily protein n=1 Tax=Myroides pelagicus TaxID=270914 RepID=A0A7K1GKT8_9FLAO|nr:4'-phosphopantetheinyl transferase superfamily protein [Myroides pelagicus]MEC4112620.1 4'-phosphopantetheinyl transferase superfamily protein [Myroides pelagicus]MTH29502.1 4'-phosphopantetheinyl transferase superfamily protein [Myroides pelagicus]
MPLYKTIDHSKTTTICIWKVEETLEELREGLVLREETQERLISMKSEVHQKGFLAIRHLLIACGYSDLDLSYDACGKPYLNDGMAISISHSFDYATIIIGNEVVGIDIEKIREKIIRIANKFCRFEELEMINPLNNIEELTEIWCAKEAMFKMCDSRSLSFKEDMSVDLNGFSEVGQAAFTQRFSYYTVKLEGFLLVYAVVRKD